MTNFGMTGTMIGIPIIRYPEVAIVGLGAITKKVKAMPDDSIAIRSIMMVSLTFDHRVLDGLYGCGFLNELEEASRRRSLARFLRHPHRNKMRRIVIWRNSYGWLSNRL